jgi:hypothetical protein
MNTYRLTCNWEEFFAFIKETIPVPDNINIAFLYSGDQIYIRSLRHELIDLIARKYPLTISETPDTSFTENRDWHHVGNAYLFRQEL